LGDHDRDAAVRARFGLLRHVWHPAVFVFAVYMIVLSTIALAFAAR
jgi:protein AaeX